MARQLLNCRTADLLACWFEGSGERWADDVAIMGSRLIAGSEARSEPFVMADAPEFIDRKFNFSGMDRAS